jgi:hypothetical protein
VFFFVLNVALERALRERYLRWFPNEDGVWEPIA